MSALLDCPRFGASTWGVAELSDDDLMHFVRTQDDTDAFAELVSRHRSRALKLARQRLGGDSHRAEDLVQELFLRLYTKRQSYRASARFGGYLQRILINLCASESRRRRARPAQALGALDPGYESNEDLQEACARQRRALPAALAKLPELHRQALHLRYTEDLSCQQIAERLGRSTMAVKSLLFRAREALRRHLAEGEGSPASVCASPTSASALAIAAA